MIRSIKEDTGKGKEQIKAIKFEALNQLGYFLKPLELFYFLAQIGINNFNSVNFVEN